MANSHFMPLFFQLNKIVGSMALVAVLLFILYLSFVDSGNRRNSNAFFIQYCIIHMIVGSPLNYVV